MDARQIARALAAWWAESSANKATILMLGLMLFIGLAVVFPTFGLLGILTAVLSGVFGGFWFLAREFFKDFYPTEDEKRKRGW